MHDSMNLAAGKLRANFNSTSEVMDPMSTKRTGFAPLNAYADDSYDMND